MSGAAAAPALLFVTLGLALAFARRCARIASLLVLLATSAISFMRLPSSWQDWILVACWLSVIATATSVYFVCRLNVAAVALSLNAGIWASAVSALSGSQLALFQALPCVAIAWPASWAMRRCNATPVRMVSSWLIAVAALALTMQLLPVTLGDQPDHLE